MQNNAYSFYHKIKKSPKILQPAISRFIKKARIVKIKLIKDKYIIDGQYKILCLVFLSRSLQKTMVLEIHDNLNYWERAVFSLNVVNEFKYDNKSLVAEFFYSEKKRGLIFRENLTSLPLNLLILKKAIKTKKILRLAKTAAWWLAQLHNYPTKKTPNGIRVNLNLKIEKKILHKTLDFIKPNIEKFKPQIYKNLNLLLPKMAKEKRPCVIHGDYQFANMMLKDSLLKIIDFDTLELGSPGRDLGRFIQQTNNFFPKKTASRINRAFLQEYLKFSPYKYNDIKKSIALHQAEMIQYNILDKIWGNKIPNAGLIKKLINKQTNILKKV